MKFVLIYSVISTNVLKISYIENVTHKTTFELQYLLHFKICMQLYLYINYISMLNAKYNLLDVFNIDKNKFIKFPPL